jgi:hypothetical protein
MGSTPAASPCLSTAGHDPAADADEVFPDTGDVSYVMFHHAYLELVEIG